MNFEIIREARKSLHMTQVELADRLKVNRATISKYETGEILPSLKQLERLTEVLGIPAEELLTGGDLMKFPSEFPNIEAERAKRNMTYEDFAEKMGVTRKTVYSWLSKGNIPQSKLEQMAQLFQCGTDYLLRRKVRASTIGENIKQLRESHGMTQTELGKIAGVTDKAVSTWEADTKVPRMEAVQRMADYFEIPKSIILDGDVAPTIGEKIRKTRIEKGMTQKQVAEKCDMADSAIRKYESGKVCPKIETLKRMAEALGVDFYSLADTEEAPHPAGDPLRRIAEACEKLTDAGREKAAEIVEIIAGNPEYQRKADDDITIIILKGGST